MRGLTAGDFLDLSDDGGSLDWITRGLMLTGAAWRQASPAECAALPVGARNRLVLALRVLTFGREMPLRLRCRACGADLVARVDLGAVLAGHAAEPPATVRVAIEDEEVEARLPSSGDLLATAGLPPGEGEWALYERCLVSRTAGDPVTARQRIAEAMALADPLAVLEVDLECDQCHTRSSEPFDIVTCFWKEIDAGARRAELDVHALASAYGWSEEQILALSPARRARYLALKDR